MITDYLAAIALMVLGLVLMGCGAHQLDAFASNANTMVSAVEAQYKAELNSATDEMVPAVEKKYDAFFKAHDAFVDLWTLANDAALAVEQFEKDGGDVTSLAAKALRIAQGAISAYMTLREMYDALRAVSEPVPARGSP